jgi:Fe-S cluster assembly protein SufD
VTGITLEALATPDRLNQREPSWRREARLAAIDWLSTHPVPTHHDEPWRYTPAEELAELVRVAVHPRTSLNLASGQVDVMAGDHGGPRLVFVNGVFAAGASKLRDASGATVRPLSALERNSAPGPAVETERLDWFAALNSLAGDDGAVITIDADTLASAPIHIVHVAAPDLDTSPITYPGALVRIEPGATATVIESYVGFTGAALTNAATVIEVHDSASLTYHRIQAEAPNAAHVGHIRIRAGHQAKVACTSFSIGGRISRVAFDISLTGDHAQLDIDGLYVPGSSDRHDHVITAEHLGSHTRSSQTFKGVVADRARGSFTGQVIVRPGTTDTVANQTNHSLLLSGSAESVTRPWLEILADDVRCSHGATIGRLDDEALFYLRTRGIPEPEARRVLVEGFSSEILDVVGVDTLRDHLRRRIGAKQQRSEEQR